MLREATRKGCFQGVRLGNPWVEVSHLQFADDTLIFCKALEGEARAVKRTLRCFELVSGLKVNFHKSQLIGIGVSENLCNQVAANLYSKSASCPISYLGFPLGANPGLKSTWNPIVKKVQKRLGNWKNRYLSIGGRVTLIKSVLRSLPVYYMSIFKIPIGVSNHIERLMRNFLWCGVNARKKIHLVKWNSVVLRKENGGLSIGFLRDKNAGLLAKWWWRFGNDQEAWWREVVCKKYGCNTSNWRINDSRWPNASSIWKGIVSVGDPDMKYGAMMEENLGIVVGSRNKAIFWNDKWLVENRLRDLFPRLYALSSNKEGKVAEMGKWINEKWSWDLQFRRRLFDWELSSWENLMDLLARINLDRNVEDRIIWKPCTGGKFSVKSFCSVSEDKSLEADHYFDGKYVWKGLAPPKVETFCWLAIRNRIPTSDLLKNRNCLPDNASTLCPLCNDCEENPDHLLLHCKWSWAVWCACLDWWGMKWCVPKSLIQLGQCWVIPKAKDRYKLIWEMLMYAVVWTIWLTRNEKVFNKKLISWREAADLVIVRLAIWVKAAKEDIVYSINDFTRAISGVRMGSHSKKVKPALFWKPPLFDTVKFNVDGSALGKPGKAGIGGVLRDAYGSVLGIFSCPVGIMDSNEAEVLAIRKALKMFSDSNWCGKRNLVIESDSMVALYWIKNRAESPWNLWSTFNEIGNLIKSIGDISFVHTPREANHLADGFAKMGARRSEDWCAWIQEQ